mgnify:CR=1 FL=1
MFLLALYPTIIGGLNLGLVLNGYGLPKTAVDATLHLVFALFTVAVGIWMFVTSDL